MKKLAVIITAIMISLTCCSSSEQTKSASQKHKDNIVYVCTGAHATKYHKHKNCKGLRNCKGKVVAVSINDAVTDGRTPCKICY